jgi:ribosomal protein L16 Arg81 hydroxylase
MKRIGLGITNVLDYFPTEENANAFFEKVKKIHFKNLPFNESAYYHMLNNSNINSDDLFLIKEQADFNFNHIDRFLGESFARKKIKLGRQQAIKQKISEGHSLKIFDIDQYHFCLERLTRDFRALFEARTTLNSYYTPAENRCLHPHRDNYHLIIFQIFGKKEWTIEKTNSIDIKNVSIDNVECE